MNYLAHFHLATDSDDWIVGALLGEYVKGPLRGEWPAAWEAGIRLHRHIDAISDRHPLRAAFAQMLPVQYRRYAGIVLDMYCDYWLSRHWLRFHDQPLLQFEQRVYALLAQQQADMPEAAARMALRLIDHNVLGIYGDWKNIASIFVRIGARLRRANPLAQAGEELFAYRDQAEAVFLELYPQLVAQTRVLNISVAPQSW